MVSQEDNHHEEKVCDVPEPVTEGDGGGQSRSPNCNNEAEGWNPNVNQDDLILQRQKEISAEIESESDLVGERLFLDQLLTEYPEDEEIYRCKIVDLKKCYDAMRKTRPDGNCFFRAFGFSLFQSLLRSTSARQEITRLRTVAGNIKADLYKLGFNFTVDDFYENFTEALDDVQEGRISTPDQLREEIFNNPSRSDYMVVFLRLVTSAHLRMNEEFFAAFIENGLSVKDFCQTEVEPMQKESDHIHVIAITEAIGVGVRINYLDRGGCLSKVNTHDFPEGVPNPAIHLLYRPGHYDVLYPRESCDVSSTAQSSNSSSSITSQPARGQAATSSSTIRAHEDVSSSSNHYDASSENTSTGVSSSKNPRLDPSVPSANGAVDPSPPTLSANGQESSEVVDEQDQPSTTS